LGAAFVGAAVHKEVLNLAMAEPNEEEAARIAEAFGGAFKDIGKAAEDTGRPFREVFGFLTNLPTRPVDEAADAIGDMADESVRARDRIQQLKDVYTGLTDALMAPATPILNAVRAMEQLAAVKADPDASVFDIAEAVFTAQSALTELGGGNLDRGISLIADAVNTTNDAIREELELLGVLDGTEVRVLISFDAEAFPISFIENQAAIAAQRAADVARETAGFGVVSGRGIGHRALGGPVEADSPYWVGERGPELIMPRTAGTVIPNHALGGGSPNVNIQVTVTGTVTADNARRLGDSLGKDLDRRLRERAA
jgi:hypothetical protein